MSASEVSTSYDFVIVDGGTAGNVLAKRLTEDPKIRVVVVESGGFDRPTLGTSRPHPKLALRASIDGMVYTRGSAEDYDLIANVTGDEGWSCDRLQNYFRKLPFNADYNSGKPLGFGWAQSTITSFGRRDSSATSYLGPRFTRRANLHILLNNRVLRLPPATHSPSGPGLRFSAVEYGEIVEGAYSSRRAVVAAKETILSAGSVGTPHVLLHSGIGDDDTRNRYNPPPVKQFLDEWNFKGPSPLTSSTTTHIRYLRLPDNLFDTAVNPSAGVNTSHIELPFTLFF
ncbi:FAD/NAD(P)-binding domain-containing protein [Pleurotus eryngii]|uniref:FAD/NAD(P)-binding domain-containing protein n=1 Tax=Pleurotus eryngii TaxID=5323 RepID=A0A9P6A261_PLEER|nr:FAD/NAD(P)-binding domain-containing protein [Pleurotus eryngii]